jgi:hypothetical protein
MHERTLNPYQKPLDQMQESVQVVLDLLGNTPKTAVTYLKLCTNPLVTNETFNNEIKKLNTSAEETQNQGLSELAGELSTLRSFFVQDPKLHNAYKNEIESIKSGSLEQRQSEFTTELQKSTRSHIKNIVQNIEGHSQQVARSR